MNELERDRADDAQRARRRDRRREAVLFGCVLTALLGPMVYAVVAKPSWRSCTELAVVLLPYAVLGLSWRRARVASPVREEKSEADYRTAPTTAEPREPRDRSDVIVVVASLLIGVAAIAVGAVFSGITWIVGCLAILTQKTIERLRARRNARLELEWERSLESADTCEVRAREWTK